MAHVAAARIRQSFKTSGKSTHHSLPGRRTHESICLSKTTPYSTYAIPLPPGGGGLKRCAGMIRTQAFLQTMTGEPDCQSVVNTAASWRERRPVLPLVGIVYIGRAEEDWGFVLPQRPLPLKGGEGAAVSGRGLSARSAPPRSCAGACQVATAPRHRALSIDDSRRKQPPCAHDGSPHKAGTARCVWQACSPVTLAELFSPPPPRGEGG
ncbi:Uncharacterised protein [Pannonibacter phragmitetus]|uniref:Uncharacterized protein n=1 Tax=Pannonibacter phragmitetus TaxID=121719 RepID=A0A379HJI9_9HYPH|nr:Uncharacterised protein [Pannonibacter phragmitetus]